MDEIDPADRLAGIRRFLRGLENGTNITRGGVDVTKAEINFLKLEIAYLEIYLAGLIEEGKPKNDRAS